MVKKLHKLIPKSLAQSDAFRKDFKEALILSNKQIDKLTTIIEMEKSFELSAKSIEEATKSLKITPERILLVLKVFNFLYRHAKVGNINKKDATNQVCEFAKSLGIVDCNDKIAAIEHIFAPKESYDRHLMIGSASTAVIPTLSTIDSVCDVRAVTDSNTGKIIGYVPRALVGIVIRDSDLNSKTIDLQVDENDIDKLLDELNKAKRLLKALKGEFSNKILDEEQYKD